MIKKSLFLILSVAGVLVYQNCVPFEGVDGGSNGFSLNTAGFPQIKAILDAKCVTCHATPTAANRNVGLATYQALIDSDILIGGNAEASTLYRVVMNGSMPQGLPALSLQETEAIRSWINAGAPSEDGLVANYPPVILMPAAQTVQLPIALVEFIADVSDQDGAVLETVWSQVSGPNTATFSNSRTPILRVSNLQVGDYVFELLAEDDFGAIATGRVSLRVNAAPNPPPPPPPPPVTTVSFMDDIFPILQARCIACHSGNAPPKGFSVETYAQVVTRVVIGNPGASLIYQRVLNDSMPDGDGAIPLSAAQKQLLSTWITENATNN